MAKDYAKSKSGNKPKSSSRSGGGMKAFILGVLTGVLLAAIGGYLFRDHWIAAKDLYQRATTKNEQPAEVIAAGPEQVEQNKKKTQDVNKKYKPLPDDPQSRAEWQIQDLVEKNSGKEKAITSASLAAHAPEVAVANKTYILACGAFSAQDKADAVKAKIAFTGLDADVKAVNGKDNSKLFSVQLGPYKSREAASKDISKLQAQGVSGCQLR